MLKITAEKRTITVEIASYLGEKKLYLSPKTVSTYENHFHILAHLINFNQELSESVTVDLCHKVAELQISQSSKNSYLRTWRAFTRYVDPSIPSPQLRSIESIKQTYSDDDIKKLTTPPKGKYDFTEYRNFVITLVLADTGMRSSSLRNIRCDDVQGDTIILRHTKTHKVQVLPFGSYTAKHLHKYMAFVKGCEYLFPNQFGKQLTENGLSDAIAKYNKARGVTLTSCHAWRHTFAKKFLLNGGDAFTLQKLLNHSDLSMTKNYCRLWDADVITKYKSPLEQMHYSKIQI